MTMLRFKGDDNGNQAERYYGKYPGVVLDNKPRDGQTHVGELLVEVPGILEETPDGAGQRAMQVWAAPCFVPGFFFIPEVNAPLWVEFAAGDINHPLWTGVWYPPGALPQTADGHSPTELQKVIQTASRHVIQLDDTSGGEKVIITHTGGAKIEIDSTDKILIKNKNCSYLQIQGKTVTISGAEKVIIEGSTVCLGSGATEKAVLGNQLNTQWQLFMTHTHPTAFGPSGPPTPSVSLDSALSNKVKVE
jgi:hypothetical protein